MSSDELKNKNIGFGGDQDLDLDLQARNKLEPSVPIPSIRVVEYLNGYFQTYGDRVYDEPVEITVPNPKLLSVEPFVTVRLDTTTGINFFADSTYYKTTRINQIKMTYDDKGPNDIILTLLGRPKTAIFNNSLIVINKWKTDIWRGLVTSSELKQNGLFEIKAKSLYDTIEKIKPPTMKYKITRTSGNTVTFNVTNNDYNTEQILSGNQVFISGLKEDLDNGLKTISNSNSTTSIGNIGYRTITLNESFLQSSVQTGEKYIEIIQNGMNAIKSPYLWDVFNAYTETFLKGQGYNQISVNKSKIINKGIFKSRYPKLTDGELDSLLSTMKLTKPFSISDVDIGSVVRTIERLSGNRLRIFVDGEGEWNMIETVFPNTTLREDVEIFNVSLEKKTDKIYNEVVFRTKDYADKYFTTITRDITSEFLYGRKTYRIESEEKMNKDLAQIYCNSLLKSYTKPTYNVKTKNQKVVRIPKPEPFDLILKESERDIEVFEQSRNGLNYTTNINPDGTLKAGVVSFQVPNYYTMSSGVTQGHINIKQSKDYILYSNKYNFLTFFASTSYKGDVGTVQVFGTNDGTIRSSDIFDLYFTIEDRYQAFTFSLDSFKYPIIDKIEFKKKPAYSSRILNISSININGMFENRLRLSQDKVTYLYKDGVENISIDFASETGRDKQIYTRLKERLKIK